MHLAAYVGAAAVAHSLAHWYHPATDPRFLSADYYQNIARTLERGRFDMMFFGSNLSIPHRHGSDVGGVIERGGQASTGLDGRLIAPMIAAVTRNLGIAATVSTTYSHPFDVARQFATLDHLTGGRTAWNVVTSLSATDAANFGVDAHPEHDTRYEIAEEYLEAAFGLWQTWDEDALVQDKAARLFARPGSVHALGHEGEHFSIAGPLTVPRSPQGRPVIAQAGTSARGRDFGARWAEVIFAIDRTAEGRARFYADVKARAATFGRGPEQIKILQAIMPFVGETEQLARLKLEYHNSIVDPLAGLATLSNQSDHDFSAYDLDLPIAQIEVDGSRGLFTMISAIAQRDDLSLRDVGALYAQSQLIPQIAGTPGQIADLLEEMTVTQQADGFMLSVGYTPGQFQEFVDLVVPELQRRGIFRREYEGSTLRSNLGLDAVESI